MDRKTKFSLRRITRYVRDFSIVVAGIAVTLYVNDRVTNQGEKRDLKLYLKAIKIEMEENIKEIDSAAVYMQKNVNYTHYLASHEKKARSIDSLSWYIYNVCGKAQTFSFKSNAFEMFKSSGVMRLLENKEDMLTIWDAYENFTEIKKLLEWYHQLKWAAMEKEFTKFIDSNLKPEDIVNTPVMYTFYILDIHTSILRSCRDALKETNEALEKLELVISG